MGLQEKQQRGFNLANQWLIEQLFWEMDLKHSRILEIGGSGICANYFAQQNNFERLLVAVENQQQLEQLIVYADQGAQLVVAEADNLPFKAESIDFLIANLLAPPSSFFWEEVYRLLAPTGCALFTTPAYGIFQNNLSPEQQAKLLGKENLQIEVKIPVFKSVLGADLTDQQFKQLPDKSNILDAYLIVKRK